MSTRLGARPDVRLEEQGRLAELETALERETTVVRELSEHLRGQRAAVAADDVASVNGSIDAIGRVLLTLSEARERRARLVQDLTGDPALSLARLPDLMGIEESASFEAARLRLRAAAEEAAREAAINRGVLRRAVESGESFLQELFSTVGIPDPVYGPGETAPEPAKAGALVNRRA